MKKNTISLYKILFILALSLLPYDSIRGIMPSTYRPISVYIFILVSLCLTHIRMGGEIKVIISVLCFYVYGIISSFFTTYMKLGLLSLYMEFFITLTLGVFVFLISTICFCKYAREKTLDQYLDFFMTVIGNAYLLPLCVGCIEFLSLKGILPFSVKLIINAVFGGETVYRISMTTHEASWASMHLIFIMPVYFYLLSKRKYLYKTALCISAALFFYISSLQGVLSLITGFMIYSVLISYVNGNLKALIKNVLFASAVIIGVFAIFIAVIYYSPASYFVNRIKNFVSIKNLVESDASSFVRICFPVLNLFMLKDHLFFGAGGGSFPYIMADYIMHYFPWAVKFPEVARAVASRGTASAICLYLKVLGELGVVGGILFGTFLWRCIKKISLMKGMRQFKIVTIWLCFSCAVMIQFASYAYVQFWIVLAFVVGAVNCSKNQINKGDLELWGRKKA